MSIRGHWAVLVSLTILLILITPAKAAPSLRLGSQANYNLSGFLKANQSCTADPAQYTTQACGFVSLPPPNRTSLVSWYDTGVCYPGNTTCRFDPAIISIPTGSNVQWVHSGSLVHTATSNASLNGGLPSFNSGPVPQSSTYIHYFSVPGTYHYYCSIHPWMKAAVDVSGLPPPPPPPPPPTSSSIQVNLDGNVATNILAISSDVTNLRVDHRISVSISPIPGVTFTPVTEMGSFEQKITLATRVESPGTATSIILSLLRSVSQISGPPIYGTRTGQIYTGSAPVASSADSTFVVAPVAGSAVSSMIPMLLQRNGDPVYTIWWVNGPLSLGSPVQILTGSSSVTGDEKLNLGTALGTRAAWLVTSQFSQSINATSPPPTSSLSSASFALNLLWSFDKRGDLLLRSSAAVSVATVSATNEQVITGNPCAPSGGWCPTFAQVIVTRTMTADLNIALRLASTTFDLDKRMNTSPSQPSLLEAMASLPWLPFGGLGAGAAGMIGAGIWYVRARRKTVETDTVQPLPS